MPIWSRLQLVGVNPDWSSPSLLDFLDINRLKILPNTAGCYTADEANRAAHLAREVGLSDWVKIEVIGDNATLHPDVQATVEATRVLTKERVYRPTLHFGRHCLREASYRRRARSRHAFRSTDRHGIGYSRQTSLRMLRELVTEVPLIVDAGLGTASDAARAMELGFDGVLLNTAIASANDPILMASAMRDAVSAGRQAFLAGRNGSQTVCDCKFADRKGISQMNSPCQEPVIQNVPSKTRFEAHSKGMDKRAGSLFSRTINP